MSDAKPYSKADQLGAQKKPYRRKVAGRKRWEQIRANKLGPCLVCQWLDIPQTLESTLHHVVPKDAIYNGSDTESNVVSLCGDGTTGHHGLVQHGDRETCKTFVDALQNLDEHVYSYAVQKLGEYRFLRLYRITFEAA